MRKQRNSRSGETAQLLSATGDALSVADVERYARSWLLDCAARQLAKGTRDNRARTTAKLIWFLRDRELPECGTRELRDFFAYVATAHESDAGRWGNPNRRKAVRPVTIRSVYKILRSFFAFVIEEGGLGTSPFTTLKPPVARPDQIRPFSDDAIRSLLDAAKRTRHARRDEALVRFLLDTGARASEVCALNVADVSPIERRAVVRGKGDKYRVVWYGRKAARALVQYLNEEPRRPEAPLFTSDRGLRAGERLTRSGLLQLIERLGKAAGLEAVRCSPHTFRHSMAVGFLRRGGDVFALMQLLGHSSLEMTRRYVQLAKADLENQARRFLPGDGLAEG